MIPSMNCCMPNKSGNAAKGISDLVLVFLRVAEPIADNGTLATKLAVAEKHIVIVFYQHSLILDSNLSLRLS